MVSYLIENLECERAFLRRLWGMWNSLDPILNDFGLTPHCCWALIEVEMRDLVSPLEGDVDILIGQTAWSNPNQFDAALQEFIKEAESSPPNALIHFVSPHNFAADMVAGSGGLQWPPPTNYIAGIEVKCSRLDQQIDPYNEEISERNMRSTKASWQDMRKINLQIDKLARLGCDGVALLDLIANPPADGINMGAWVNAELIADKTEKAMSRVLSSRLSADSPAGHWVYSVGAVAGGDEIMRGTGVPRKYREAKENLYVSDTERSNNRKKMEHCIVEILERMPKPYSLPALFINCRKCRTIHSCAMDIPCNQ